MSLRQRVFDTIKERKQRVLNGFINCIPSPLTAFKYDYPGVERATYYLVSGGSKSSKTKITNFLFVYAPILYAFHHQDKVRVRLFIVLLEETKEAITMKFICYLLFVLYRKRVDIKTLKSVDEDRVVPDDVLELIHGPEITAILDFFEEHVTFIPDRNPTGIFNTLKDYAKNHGKIHKKKVEGFEQEVFDYYEPDDPDEYVLCVVDHVSRLSEERGMDLRMTIKKMSEYMMIVRNKYGYSPVIIQQQNSKYKLEL